MPKQHPQASDDAPKIVSLPAYSIPEGSFSFASLVELLIEVEYGGDRTNYICPVCHGWQLAGHEPGCRLDAAIKAGRIYGAEFGIEFPDPVDRRPNAKYVEARKRSGDR